MGTNQSAEAGVHRRVATWILPASKISWSLSIRSCARSTWQPCGTLVCACAHALAESFHAEPLVSQSGRCGRIAQRQHRSQAVDCLLFVFLLLFSFSSFSLLCFFLLSFFFFFCHASRCCSVFVLALLLHSSCSSFSAASSSSSFPSSESLSASYSCRYGRCRCCCCYCWCRSAWHVVMSSGIVSPASPMCTCQLPLRPMANPTSTSRYG